MISARIADGVTFEKILDDIRDNVRNIYDPIAITTKKDLFNIERDFNLIQGRLNPSDYVSVALWIEKMNELPADENPIVYFEQEDEHFTLIISTTFQQEMLLKFGSKAICIDSTHNTNEYELHLTTIVVIDEFGNGFPAAYYFSKKKR